MRRRVPGERPLPLSLGFPAGVAILVAVVTAIGLGATVFLLDGSQREGCEAAGAEGSGWTWIGGRRGALCARGTGPEEGSE